MGGERGTGPMGEGGGVGNARWGFGTYVEGGQCCLWFGARLLVGRRLVVMSSGQKKRQEASKRTVWSEILLIVMSRSANGVPDTAVLVSMVRHIHPQTFPSGPFPSPRLITSRTAVWSQNHLPTKTRRNHSRDYPAPDKSRGAISPSVLVCPSQGFVSDDR